MDRIKKLTEQTVQNAGPVEEIVSELTRALENEERHKKDFHETLYTLAEVIRMKSLELEKQGLSSPLCGGVQLNALACLAVGLCRILAKDYDANHQGGAGNSIIYSMFSYLFYRAYWTEEGPPEASALLMKKITTKN